MNIFFKAALFVLLICGVFGADEDKVKIVVEGDSVTLNPDPAQIQGFNEIQWRFKNGNQPIAYTSRKKLTYSEDERFRDRLKLDPQTGSLTITNIKTKHSGVYRLRIELDSGQLNVDYTVTVNESPSIINDVKGEMKMESVTEGDRVTLQTDVTKVHGDELIVWRFGDEGKLIAKTDIEAKSSPLYYEERSRDRLELDHQTGSLIITNSRITDSGLYRVRISSSKQTLYKRFTVTVSEAGLSPGAVAGIVIVVLLVFAAAAAAVIYYRHKISQLQKQTLSVTEGEDVTLKPDSKINEGDEIQWQFGDDKHRTLIAELRGETRRPLIYDYNAYGRFRDRLDLDETTGSLTIMNTRTEHSGPYKLHIRTRIRTLQQKFFVTVYDIVEEKSVNEGSVTLNPDTEIQRDDQILWMFGDQDTVIAQIKGGTVETYEDANERFRGRLELDEETGSLTITDFTDEHTGLYKLLTISSSRGTSCKKFWVSEHHESAAVEMEPLLEVPEGVNEQEGTSSL